MPVTRTAQLKTTIQSIQIDMVGNAAVIELQVFLDNDFLRSHSMRVEGNEFLQHIAAMPTEGLSRADDITRLIYEVAVERGIVSGDIS